MSTYRRAKVDSIRPWAQGVIEAALLFQDGATGPGLVFEALAGAVSAGDEVVANTTAVDLGLGSGGYHFVLWNLTAPASLDTGGAGHIMKLRYTPLQFNVEAAEERLEATDEDLTRALEGIPVIAGSVHSQLLPAALAYRHARSKGKLVYLMTDGGALPAAFSRTVSFLRGNGYLDGVITCGNAFGGDLEAVTIFGGLLAARRLMGAEAVVALMGPGIVGTGSSVGFTGMEQGVLVNAACTLGGMPVAIPRISFKDARERHHGLSHHTVSAMKYGACTRAVIPIPKMDADRRALVLEQVDAAGLGDIHEVLEVDASVIAPLLEECELKPTVMGRGFDEEPEYFMAAGAAGLVAGWHGGVDGKD